jgi:hypothetical protein
MIPEDIEKLIGGYATGTLSEEERRKLFEAALDNQDLFNALHGDHALKQLLDDPVSREMVRRAAAGAVSRARTSWFLRRWIWAATAAGAVVAAVLAITLVDFRQTPKPLSEIAQVRREVTPPPALLAAPRSSDAVTALAPEHALKARRVNNPAVNTIAPPTPSAPAPQESTGQIAPQTANGFRGQDQMQVAQALDNAVEMKTKQSVLRSAAVGALAAPPAQIVYTLSRKMPSGDYLSVQLNPALEPGEIVRVTVIPRIAGPLGVWQWDAAHPNPSRIFPIVDADMVQLRAMESYVVPLDIVVTAGEHLRITVGSSAVEIAFPLRTP